MGITNKPQTAATLKAHYLEGERQDVYPVATVRSQWDEYVGGGVVCGAHWQRRSVEWHSQDTYSCPRFLPSSALKEVLRAVFTVCIKSTNFIPTHNLPKNRHCHQLVMWKTSQKKGEKRHLGGESARRKVGRPSVWGMKRDPSVQGLPVQFARGGSER